MSIRTKACFVVFLGILAVQFSAPKSAAELKDTNRDRQELQHEVTVTLKLIQVFVTDKQGNAVTDLSKEDFRLLDNNKLQAITDFEVHLLSRRGTPLEEALAATEPEPARHITERMNRKFIFLFDVSRNSVAGLGRSKRAAHHIVDRLVEGTDEIGVFSFSEFKGLMLHEYLTSDFGRVQASIENLKEIAGKPSQSGLNLATELARAEAEMGGATKGEGEETGGSAPQGSLSQRSERNVNPESEAAMLKNYDFMAAMQDMAKSLRYVEGYKNIIFFSYGFPHQLIEGDMLFRKTYHGMASEFATSSCPIFGINTLGIKVRAGGNTSLQDLAKMTGGEYFESVVEYESIAEGIQNLTGNYYVLGYYIDEKTDGEYHEIEVKVDRPDYEVHAQSGYFNPKPFSEYSQFEKSMHLVDLAFSERSQLQVPVRFDMTALPYTDGEETRVAFISQLPQDRQDEIFYNQTELLTLVLDRANNTVVASRGEVSFSELPLKNIYQYTLASLPPGEYHCKMVMRNLKTGRGAIASTELALPEPVHKSFALYPPMLLIPEQPAHFLRVSQGEEKSSLNDIYPFFSSSFSPVISCVPRGAKKALAVLRCRTENLPQPDIEIKVVLVGKNGKERPLKYSLLEAKEMKDCDALLLELQLPHLAPGDYTLDIRGTEFSSSQESRVTKKVTFLPN